MLLSVVTAERAADVALDGRVRCHDVDHVEAEARILDRHGHRAHSASGSMSSCTSSASAGDPKTLRAAPHLGEKQV